MPSEPLSVESRVCRANLKATQRQEDLAWSAMRNAQDAYHEARASRIEAERNLDAAVEAANREINRAQ